MKFTQYYSSSSGNLYTIESAIGKRLLIECGVRWPQIQAALDYRLDNVVGCLLTHEHKDHSKSVKNIIQAGIDVYMSGGTASALEIFGERRAVVFGKKCGRFDIGEFTFWPFATNHDAEDPRGYVVQCDGEWLLFATDTSHITQRFSVAFDIIAIECSYDHAMLEERVESGTINESLAKRLLTSHMERQETLRYLRNFCDLSKCRQIHLLHLSRDNIEAAEARQAIESELFIPPTIIL